jgi:hypothetical protein
VNKDTRNAIERATQRARKLLEADFAAQLEGDFDVHRDGRVAAQAGKHLSPRDAYRRERIVAAVEHKRAAGLTAADATRDYLRDAAFTTLNRFVALKMLEARELVQECITKGEQSGGYREFCGMAPGLPLLPESAGYRLYIESLFDELSTEVKVLFDRRDPSSVLWPKRATFEQLLEILNDSELSSVWVEDETIGWVYQFFNGQDERRKMREESQAPRNSRELAVRNQFFTPRYVVQFLTDNTLGRIWYEMRKTRTALAELCEYMVRKPGEEFPSRAKKDPRDLLVLDPACGSGHFLLYAFDLLLAIYEEAHADSESPKSQATGRTLAEDYPSRGALKKALPALVLSHNLYGVDIDPRCAQIAQLALWMRAQKAYRDLDIGRHERAQIRRSGIVVAEPLVADDQIVKDFVSKLGDAALGRVFTSLVGSLGLAGDLGLLLRVEQLVARQAKRGEMADLFAPAEETIRAALDQFVREESGATSTRRRLFADDAAHGVALLTVAEKKFDVVLMNPPFGDATDRAIGTMGKEFSGAGSDIGAMFVHEAATRWCPHGRVGVLLSTAPWFKPAFERWRDANFYGANAVIRIAAHLGGEVLDGATVNASPFVLDTASKGDVTVFRLTRSTDLESDLWRATANSSRGLPDGAVFRVSPLEAAFLPSRPFCYWASTSLRSTIGGMRPFEGNGGNVRTGLQTSDEDRFCRAWWEVSPDNTKWMPYAKSSPFSPFWDDYTWSENVGDGMREVLAFEKSKPQNTQWFGRPGVTYPSKSVIGFNVRLHPVGCGFAHSGCVAFSDDVDPLALLAFLGSRPVEYLISLFVGDLQGKAGVHPNQYEVGILQRLPWPGLDAGQKQKLSALAVQAVDALRLQSGYDETSRVFVAPFQGHVESWQAAAEVAMQREQNTIATVAATRAELDAVVLSAYGFTMEDEAALNEAFETRVPPASGRWRVYFGQPGTDIDRRRFAELVMSWLHGCVVGRWRYERVFDPQRMAAPDALFQPPSRSPGMSTVIPTIDPSGCAFPPVPADGVLVDDLGHERDVGRLIGVALSRICGSRGDILERSLCELLGVPTVRDYLSRADGFFATHIRLYTKSRRKAPIYWQLATPSASYAVWLYIHTFSKDTLFRVQNDYVAPKLAHEERRLESLASELRDGATAAQRKQLAAQEGLVEELRVFLDEVKRIAPLWKPNLDDGVIINFAPLWRLVPQHRDWQKELKSTWDALADGKYDWAHLAMHLWPERVVPKCAQDRSLAIAHRLESVFWVEGANGKWSARKTPTKSVDELVQERTSPAVKAALKSLLDAPVASRNSTGRRGAGRRTVASGAEAGGA